MLLTKLFLMLTTLGILSGLAYITRVLLDMGEMGKVGVCIIVGILYTFVISIILVSIDKTVLLAEYEDDDDDDDDEDDDDDDDDLVLK